MSFTASFNLPRTEEIRKKLLACIDFLQDSSDSPDSPDSQMLGNHTFIWECQISRKFVGISIKRHDRGLGDYYRTTFQIISPEIPGLPTFVFDLTDTYKKELLSALQIESKK